MQILQTLLPVFTAIVGAAAGLIGVRMNVGQAKLNRERDAERAITRLLSALRRDIGKEEVLEGGPGSTDESLAIQVLIGDRLDEMKSYAADMRRPDDRSAFRDCVRYIDERWQVDLSSRAFEDANLAIQEAIDNRAEGASPSKAQTQRLNDIRAGLKIIDDAIRENWLAAEEAQNKARALKRKEPEPPVGELPASPQETD